MARLNTPLLVRFGFALACAGMSGGLVESGADLEPLDFAVSCMEISTAGQPDKGSPARTPEPEVPVVLFAEPMSSPWQLDDHADSGGFGEFQGLGPLRGFGRRLDRPPQA